MIDLAIVVPSIRSHKINRLFNSIAESIGNYSYKFIVCGPYDPKDQGIECEYIHTMASPNKCVQQATVELAQDCEFIKWSTDDAVYFKDALKEMIDDLYANPKHFGICKYTEDGPPGYPSGKDDIYYYAKTHGDMQRLIGVKNHYLIGPVSMYRVNDFMNLGGLECSYEHINMSTHDLAFRAQESGIRPIISRSILMHCDSDPKAAEHIPLHNAYVQNDYPVFRNKYSQPEPLKDKLVIDPYNYKNYEDVWRRFK
jgi:hypothetical protein